MRVWSDAAIRPRWRSGKAEANIAVAVRRVVRVPVRRADVPRVVVPRAAAQHTQGAQVTLTVVCFVRAGLSDVQRRRTDQVAAAPGVDIGMGDHRQDGVGRQLELLRVDQPETIGGLPSTAGSGVARSPTTREPETIRKDAEPEKGQPRSTALNWGVLVQLNGQVSRDPTSHGIARASSPVTIAAPPHDVIHVAHHPRDVKVFQEEAV